MKKSESSFEGSLMSAPTPRLLSVLGSSGDVCDFSGSELAGVKIEASLGSLNVVSSSAVSVGPYSKIQALGGSLKPSHRYPPFEHLRDVRPPKKGRAFLT